MCFNHGLEKKRFEKEWGKLRAEYAAAGMSEDVIQKMYEYDCKVFNRDRSFYEHSQPLDVGGNDDESESPLIAISANMFTPAVESDPDRRGSWIDEIENEALYGVLVKLPKDEIELLTLYVIEGFNQAEIAVIMNISQQAVAKRFRKIKTKFSAAK